MHLRDPWFKYHLSKLFHFLFGYFSSKSTKFFHLLGWFLLYKLGLHFVSTRLDTADLKCLLCGV